MDAAGGWGKGRAHVAGLSDGQRRMVAPIPDRGGSAPKRFSVADFQANPERTRCTCPNGQVSTRASRHGAGDGVSVRVLAAQCRDCPLRPPCRDPKANSKGQRSVCISDDHIHLRDALTCNQTPAGRAVRGGRWQVEPTIAWLVRSQGCRRARRVGQAAQFQRFQAGALRNLRMGLSRVRRGLAPRPAA